MKITKVTRAARKVTRVARRARPVPPCGAVIVAAGSAVRMEGVDKILADLDGRPVIARTIQTFQDCEAIQEIVVVARPDQILPIRDLSVGMDKVRCVVAGGGTRQESVIAGLNALSEDVELAAIHDGARPLVTWRLIDRVVRAAASYGAAAPALPVKDTVKQVRGGVVAATPDRVELYAVQTPQVFDFDLLRGALKKAAEAKKTLTDDCSAVEALGMSVKIVPGEETNLKITTPLDWKIARLLAEEADI